ncbi:hypothetical protein EGW08_007875, partial [Elysia chlorotica]
HGSATPPSRVGSTSPASTRRTGSPNSHRAPSTAPARDNVTSPASSTGSFHDNRAGSTPHRKSRRRGKLSVHFAGLDLKDDSKDRKLGGGGSTPGHGSNSFTDRKPDTNRKTRHQLVLSDLNLNSTSLSQSSARIKFEAGLAQEKHLAEIDKIFTKKHILPAIKKIAPQRKLSAAVPARFSTDTDRPALTLRRGSDAQSASILRPHRLSTGVQPPALPQVLVQPPEEDGEGEEGEEVKEEMKKAPSGEKIFIEVAHLEEGDVFGLEHVLLGNISDVTSCSLVSAGAEVVLINKKFFQKHLTEETAKDIREK